MKQNKWYLLASQWQAIELQVLSRGCRVPQLRPVPWQMTATLELQQAPLK